MRGLASRIVALLLTAIVSWAAAAEQAPVIGTTTASVAAAGVGQTGAPLVINNRTVFVFRGTMLGLNPRERADAAVPRIESVLARGGPGKVTLRHTSEGWGVEVDGVLAFLVAPSDIGAPTDDALEQAAQRTADDLRMAIDVGREVHDVRLILIGLGFSVLATLVYAGIVAGLFAGERRIHQSLAATVQKHAAAIKVGGVTAIGAGEIPVLTKRALDVLAWLLILIAT